MIVMKMGEESVSDVSSAFAALQQSAMSIRPMIHNYYIIVDFDHVSRASSF
jgi:hypothetical protein